MNGAELLMRSAVKAGIEVCLANAGTTELPILLALDGEPRIRPVLGLFEGVCTGAADGYGRMLERPAMTLLHLGPGFANGIANLHNARRARTPVVNLVGEHTTWHRSSDPPLNMNTDIEALAASVSGFTRTNTSPSNLSQDIADAVSASVLGQISTLILPNDYLWAKCRGQRIASPGFSFEPVETRAIESAARLLKGAGRRALVLGGNALRRRGLQIAVRIQAATDCDLLASTFAPYLDRGIDLPDVRRIPYFPEPAFELTSRYDAVVLVGSQEPVTFFGYEGIPSYLFDQHLPRASIATDKQNVVEALECLADAVGAPARFRGRARRVARPDIKKLRGVLTAEQACRVLAATQPDDAIIVDEGITSSASYHPLTGNLPPHSILTVSGGSIGYGMPCATGTALACPDRRTINFQADGSAMYTIQALWTQAREELNVTTLICSNRSYHILRAELERAHITITGPSVASLIDLDRPNIDWVQVSQGMGVPATAVDTAEALALELAKAVHEPGPNLIEMRLTTPSKALDVDK